MESVGWAPNWALFLPWGLDENAFFPSAKKLVPEPVEKEGKHVTDSLTAVSRSSQFMLRTELLRGVVAVLWVLLFLLLLIRLLMSVQVAKLGLNGLLKKWFIREARPSASQTQLGTPRRHCQQPKSSRLWYLPRCPSRCQRCQHVAPVYGVTRCTLCTMIAARCMQRCCEAAHRGHHFGFHRGLALLGTSTCP